MSGVFRWFKSFAVNYFFVILLVLSVHTLEKLHGEEKELIPLEIIFGNPSRANVTLSPNGMHLAFTAPYEGVMNLWVRALDTGKEWPVTFDNHRGVLHYVWGYDSSTLLYLQDKGGNENWKIYAADLATQQVRVLTPFEGVSVEIVAHSWKQPDRLLIAMNKEDPALRDLYQLNFKTGECERIQKNPGNVSTWFADADLQVMACCTFNDDGSTDVLVKSPSGQLDRRLLRWTLSESMLSNVLSVSKDGKSLYLCDARAGDSARLVRVDLVSAEVESLLEVPRYGVQGAIVHPTTGAILAACSQKERLYLYPFNGEYQEDFAYLHEQLPNVDIHVQSLSLDANQWIIVTQADIQPSRCYFYDRQQKKLIFLFDFKPALASYQLQKMQPISFHARDGLLIEGYLTLPFEGARQAPLVLIVHGGPHVRDEWGCVASVQWLANRGYGVLQVNYRGSSGYGKAHLDAGIREWGRKMQEDLTDAVQWAIQTGVADPSRIAIFGGSYGGYAALCGAAFTPDLYAAAIDIVGPSNLITLIRSFPPYWKMFLASYYVRVGNPDTEEALLKSRSPLFFADQIKTPLLIAQGANDPRVTQIESEQIVQALKDRDIPHEYLLYPDEGHGFQRPANRLDFYAHAEKFLARYLGGRSAQ